jgi:glycosyltransferase involved in cell wall biosynthesis
MVALKKGLTELGCDIIEVNDPYNRELLQRKNTLPQAAIALLKHYRRLYHKYQVAVKGHKPDILWVSFESFPTVPLAKILKIYTKSILVFDPLISQYDTHTEAKPLYSRAEWMAEWLRWHDRLPTYLSDITLMDTKPHCRLMADVTGVSLTKFKVVPIASNQEVFFPQHPIPEERSELKVLWYLWASKLHGLEYGLEAACALLDQPNIHFTFVFPFQAKIVTKRPEIQGLLQKLSASKNVKLIEWTTPLQLSLTDLAQFINQHDVTLGGFGGIEKARNVILNKEIEGMACGRVVITQQKAPGITELKHMENCLLCPEQNAASIANAILMLAHDRPLLRQIGQAGYETFLQKFTPRAAAAAFLQAIEEYKQEKQMANERSMIMTPHNQ